MFLVTAESFPRVSGNKFGPLPSSSCLTRFSHDSLQGCPSQFLHTVSDQKMECDNAKSLPTGIPVSGPGFSLALTWAGGDLATIMILHIHKLMKGMSCLGSL